MRLKPAFLTVMVASASPVVAAGIVEPRAINAPSDLRPGEGAVLMSIRHTIPLFYTMHLWFDAAEPSPVGPRTLQFERKVGLGGLRRMLARTVKIYAVPAGQWQLRAHGGGCDTVVAPGQVCTMSFGATSVRMASASYDADWLTISMAPGSFADVGELILEMPLPTAATAKAPSSPDEMFQALRFKVRPIPEPEKAAAASFAMLPRGGVTVAPTAQSAVHCEPSPDSDKLTFIPFTC